jgi:hypothetical protein
MRGKGEIVRNELPLKNKRARGLEGTLGVSMVGSRRPSPEMGNGDFLNLRSDDGIGTEFVTIEPSAFHSFIFLKPKVIPSVTLDLHIRSCQDHSCNCFPIFIVLLQTLQESVVLFTCPLAIVEGLESHNNLD